MKKPTNYNKIAAFPETPPEPILAPPKEARSANDISNRNQPDSHKQSDFSSELTIRIPKSLRAHLSLQADYEGVPLTEYILYKLTQ